MVGSAGNPPESFSLLLVSSRARSCWTSAAALQLQLLKPPKRYGVSVTTVGVAPLMLKGACEREGSRPARAGIC